jgi:hypothetical protein
VRARYGVVVTAGLFAAAVAGCAGGTEPPAPAPRPDVSGTWVHPDGPGGASLRPAEGFPLTPWAEERMQSERPTRTSDFRETTDPAVLYSDPNGYPRIHLHPMKFKLVQTDDYVYQLWEYNQNWRQIAMNQEHSPDAAPAWLGNAVGKWDGDTLVVDSTGYKPSTWLNSQGLPHTEDLHIVERIRRDGDTLAMEFTFDDPGAFTKPWSVQLNYVRVQAGAMIETIFTISDELLFRERFLGVPAPIPIRR